MVQAELRRSGFEQHVRAGMVLTGGASKMEGVVELAEEMLQMPVRVGIPQHVTGLGEVVNNPVHASGVGLRSEEHTSELQSLMRISYAVFCLKKKKQTNNIRNATQSNLKH